MSTQFAARRWTYEEFANLPDDGNRYEVIGGELYVTPSPRKVHQVLAARITALLTTFIETHSLGEAIAGPFDVLFREGDYYAPDFLFVRGDRVGIATERGVEGAPDLVVEIVSPTTAARDRGIKRLRYLQFGVSEYWVVDAEARRIEIYRGGRADAVEIVTTEFDWQPIPGWPVLKVNLPQLLRDFR
jgi:Uma2 family endonuclease